MSAELALRHNTPSESMARGERLVYVIGSLEVGGAEQHLVRVATALKRRGWCPEIFVLTLGGPLSKVLEAEGIPIRGIELPEWLRKIIRNARLAARVRLLATIAGLAIALVFRRPAAVHYFLPAAYLVGGIASVLSMMRPRIMSRRSLRDYQLAHPIYARVERSLHARIDVACGNSKAVVEQLREEGIATSRLRLIYNGIDMAPYVAPFDRSARRVTWGIGEQDLVLVIVANLIPYKGHDDLLNALATVVNDLPATWTLLCVGRDDGIGDELARQANQLDIGRHVHWLGARSDVPDILRLSDIGVLCSHQEGFSNAILEAMAAALPMVVTDVGGNAEAVIDGETGYVVPPRQPGALGLAILRMSGNPEREAMGRRGRERVEQHFSLVSCVDAYEAMYRKAIDVSAAGGMGRSRTKA